MDLNSILQIPVIYVLPFILAITIIVFVHEYGHYKVARWCGVKIDAFSIGFGREIFGWHDKHGTRWKYCWLPFGGYVRFTGDANAASQPSELSEEFRSDPNIFHNKPIWQKAAVVAAGPIANFILAILFFSLAFLFVGMPYADPKVREVRPNSAAAAAGILPGDLILKIQGREMKSPQTVTEAVFMRGGEPLVVVINRNGSLQELTVTPTVEEEKDSFGGTVKVGRLGVVFRASGKEIRYERLWPHQALAEGTRRTWFIISTTGKYIGKLFTGNESVKQIGGPIAMAKGAGDMASSGFFAFVGFIALLSVSIGLINLFPVPMLDGGHLVFYAIEALRGKPLGPNAQDWAFRIGFSFVIMLMLLGFYNDIGRVVSVVTGG